MKIKMSCFRNAALLGAALLIPIAMAPTALRADDHKTVTYHDKQHNDDHEWNAHENQAYRVYAKQNHRRYQTFSTLKEDDQQAYWGWRHEHSDAQLNINIH
jgi:hypothetical protein